MSSKKCEMGFKTDALFSSLGEDNFMSVKVWCVRLSSFTLCSPRLGIGYV